MRGKLIKLAALFLALNISLLGMTAEEFEEKKESFRTDEYKKMGGLDLINVAEAYALGYTGKGVTLGISDDYVNFAHNEFINKGNSFIIGEVPKETYWEKYNHGTHVGGIISASKDGVGMHGVAFDSELVSSIHYENIDVLKKGYDYFNSRNDIKVINNSWGMLYYIDDDYLEKGLAALKEIIQDDEEYNILKKSIENHGKLLIFCNHNSGHITPSVWPLMTYEDEEVKNNVIGVTALNSNYSSDKAHFLAVYSDLNKYNEENSISAPGTDIISANAAFKSNGEKYISMSGTSMAAPMVTGVGGLVQEAFPYMSGKQIGDVLLSTANKDLVKNQKYILTLQADMAKEDGIFYLTEINLIYFNKIDEKENSIKKDVIEYIKTAIKDKDGYLANLFPENITDEEMWKAFKEWGMRINVYEDMPYEIVYGQGVVDAGKAVRGLGALNARRLTKDDRSDKIDRIKTYLSDDKKQAIYRINTMGYDSVWSNDISEIKVGYIAPKDGNTDLGLDSGKYSNKDLNLTEDEKEYFAKMYEFYTKGENYYDYTKDDGTLSETGDSKEIIVNGKEYIAEYNKRVEKNGLAGLSVGLLKEGEGTLALTGENTYKGASIAGGGTLQIDGSITGDAYSLNDEYGIGTIAGKGTIKGNLYNYGKVQAGSWGSTNTLTVAGDFKSVGGTIVVNVQGDKNSTLVVESISKFENTKIEINGIAIPDMTYENFLKAGKTAVDIASNTSGKLSLFLGYDVVADEEGSIKTTGKNYDLKVEKTATLDSVSGISNEQRKMAGVLEEMYSNLAGRDEQREIDIFYNIKDKSLAERAFQETYGGLHTDMMNNLPLNNRISSSIYSRLSDRENIFVKEKNEIIELEDKMWTEILTSWKDIGSSRGMESFEIDMKGFILGGEFNKRFGYFLSYGENDIKGDNNSGEIRDVRGGLYLGHSAGRYSLESYGALGYQKNEAERNMRLLGLKAESEYNSWTVEAGVKGRVALTENIKPYVELNVLRYENESFTEKGAGILSQNISKTKNIYTTAGTGVELTKEWTCGKGNLLLGYERALTGYDPEMRASLIGSSSFKVRGHKQDRNHMIVKAGGEKNLENGITIYGDIESRFSSKEKDYALTVGARYSF